MTSTEFATYVRFKTRTDSTSFTDAEILALMEIRQVEIAREILTADEDILLIPMTDDLVADQREYAFDAEFLGKIKRVEAKLDETDFIPLIEIDMTSIKVPIASESDITSQFTNDKGEAFYHISRNALYIYSGTITAVTGGLKTWENTFPSAVAALNGTTDMAVDPSTTTHGIPRVLHEIWARGVIIDYKESREKPIPLSERERNYERDLAKAIDALVPANYDREVIGDIPHGSELWNEGEDL